MTGTKSVSGTISVIRDRSGTLDTKEVGKLLSNLGLSHIDPQEIISESDKNGDGFISFSEFKSAVEENSEVSHWRVLKYWLLLSSGWYTPEQEREKSPASVKEIRSKHPNLKIVSFIRHGESEANAACERIGNAKGFFNPALTEKGVTQALERRAALRTQHDEFEYDLIVVSPMKRTLQTCSIVLADYLPSLKPLVLPLIREQFSESADEGDDPQTIKKEWGEKFDLSLFPDVPQVWWYPGEGVDPTTETVASQRERSLQGDWEEPWEEVLRRASEFEDWLRTRPEKQICVISHGGFIEALVGPRLGNAEHCLLSL